jgi:hypothetical protein
MVEGDTLRWAAKEHLGASGPMLSFGTAKAHRFFGKLTVENAIAGLLGVRRAMAPIVEQYLHSHAQPVVFEAPFLDPIALRAHGSVCLIAVADPVQHRANMVAARPGEADLDELYNAARHQHEYLLKEAADNDIGVVYNAASVEDVLAQIIEGRGGSSAFDRSVR